MQLKGGKQYIFWFFQEMVKAFMFCTWVRLVGAVYWNLFSMDANRLISGLNFSAVNVSPKIQVFSIHFASR